jgi:hypothetical protein
MVTGPQCGRMQERLPVSIFAGAEANGCRPAMQEDAGTPARPYFAEGGRQWLRACVERTGEDVRADMFAGG